jgi:ParB-like chromosome segregation protein Spo0J
MTVVMTSDLDFEFAAEVAEVSNAVLMNSGIGDPMSMVDQLPETSVPVNSLVPGFHLRLTGTDAAHVGLLADAAGSVRLPPILVQKRGARIIDGMHRVEVAKLRGECTIKARIVDCTDEEALVLAVKSNTLHGLPLTRADRISSAKRILAANPDWSDRKVAMITGLSAKSIVSLRNSSIGDLQFYGKRLGRDGKRRPVDAAEGRRRAAEYIQNHPEASLREVARETDVSLGTVHDVRDKIRRGLYPEPRRGEEPAVCDPGREVAAAPLPPATSIHARSRADNAQQIAWPAISGKLQSDPSLRYTDGGRAFLRWMAQHSMQADEWREFADAIPQRWLKDVRQLAVSMSDEWRQFAEQLRYRQEAAS